jgi:hypothetical protein
MNQREVNRDHKLRGVDDITHKKAPIPANEDTPGCPFRGLISKFVKALRRKLSNSGRIKRLALSFLNAKGSIVTFFDFSPDHIAFII